MATETETQTANTGSKRAQLNKKKRENKSRVPEGQMPGKGANLAFDNTVRGTGNKEGDEKRKGNNLKKDKNSDTQANNDNSGNYRQVMAREKKRQKKKASKKEKKGAVYQGSKRALSMCWKALIPSWFTTIFIIDIFAFLHVVFPKFFCSLGEEWQSPMAAVAGDSKGSGAKSAMMKSAEPWIVVLINLLVLFVIALLIVASMILVAATNPWILGWGAAAELWDLVKDAF
ncbi:hypothetical protein K9M50_03055 [Patescibacteria group bacterium]|nr:hypothetical protein [Patescibacteria group bacterium]